MNSNRDQKYNASGYLDITAYLAIKAADGDKSGRLPKPNAPKVYICSPFAGDPENNIKKALRYCRFALTRGNFPVAPHCYFPLFMDDDIPTERELALAFGIRMLGGCRELWVFGERISEGMKKEIAAAKNKGIPVRRFNDAMEETAYETC